MAEQEGYWDELVAEWRGDRPQRLWRAHSDAVNAKLLGDWLPAHCDCVLKTDLFDETVGTGLFPLLAERAARVVGIDIAPSAVVAAKDSYASLDAVEADVRCLPFPDGSFCAVVSLSTLDHFAAVDDLVVALREIHRVLRPGGDFLLTLDNPSHPLIALRGRLPFRVLNRMGLVPYCVGVNLEARRLRTLLGEEGFAVREMTAILHCPRVLAVMVAGLLERWPRPRVHALFLRVLFGCERLARWRSRFRTGHFIAVKAIRE